MKIGIVGSGKIGGLVGTLWAKAGHKVKFSSRHPEQLNGLVASAGENASAGTSDDAAAMEIVAKLVCDAGFDPVTVGGLKLAKEFDFGSAVYNTNMSGPEIRARLGL